MAPIDSSHSRRSILFPAIGLLFVVGLLVVGICAGFALGRMGMAHSENTIAPTSTVLTEIQSLAQLITVKFVFEKVVRLDDVKWYGQNRLLMLAHGVAKAGVDLQKVRPADISVAAGQLRITLPKAQLFDVYLDEQKTEVIERSTGILRSFDQEMEHDARRQAIDEIRRSARAAGILQEAEDRARAQLTLLAKSSDFPALK